MNRRDRTQDRFTSGIVLALRRFTAALRGGGVWPPRSLRFQLLSRSLLVMAVLLLFIGIFQYVLMRDFMYRNKAQSVQAQILAISREQWVAAILNSAGGTNSGLGGMLRAAPGEGAGGNGVGGGGPNVGQGPGPGGGPSRQPPLFFPESSVMFVGAGSGVQAVLATNPKDDAEPPQLSVQEYQAALNAGHALTYRLTPDSQGHRQLVVLQPLESRGHALGVVQVSVDTRPLNEVLVRQLLIFLGLSALALLGGMLAFLPVLRRTLVPLSNMVQTVERIDSGNLDERFPTLQGQLEVDRLAMSFNGMLERIETSFEAEREAKERARRFVADASHELRTPLTSIHGFLEILLRGAVNNPDQLQKALNSMYGESERINKLVQDLLLLAKLDRTPEIELASGRLDEVLREMEPQLRLLAGRRHVELRLGEPGWSQFDKDKIKQVVLNLFHNAVQHTDAEQGRIELSLAGRAEGVLLSVRDNGSGIPQVHLPHIFDRFYRSDSSRTRKYGGAGLGLSITKSIVEAHRGQLWAESSEGEGSVFYVALPAVQYGQIAES